jgi:hypothetical protein
LVVGWRAVHLVADCMENVFVRDPVPSSDIRESALDKATCLPGECRRQTSNSSFRASRSWSSNANWDTPTSASPRSTFKRIDNAEIIDTVHHRAAPVIPASAGLHRPG